MAKVSEIKAKVLAAGHDWTPELYDYAVSRGAEADELKPGMSQQVHSERLSPLERPVAGVPQERSAPLGVYDPKSLNPLPFSFPDVAPVRLAHGLQDAFTRGFAGVLDPKRQGETPPQSRLEEVLGKVANVGGETVGMMTALPLIPVPGFMRVAAKPGAALASRFVQRVASAAPRLTAYEAIRGGAEGYQVGEGDRPLEDTLRGLVSGGFKGLGLSALFAGLPKLPAKFGGEMLPVGGLMGGMTLAQGGSLEDALISGGVGAGAQKLTGFSPRGEPAGGTSRPGATKAKAEMGRTPQPEIPDEVPPKINPPRPIDAARAIASRLERMSPESAKVGDMLREAVEKGQYQELGKRSSPVVFAYETVGKPNAAEDLRISQALEGKRPFESLTEKEARIAGDMQQYYMGVPERAKAAEMQVRVREKTGEIKKVPFPEARPDYFPRIAVDPAEVRSGATRNQLLKATVEDGYFTNEAEAGKMLDSWISLVERGARSRDKTFAKYLVQKARAEGREMTLNQAVGMINRAFKNPRIRRFGSAEYAREYDNPFYDRSAKRVFVAYSKGMERRIAESATLGQDLKKLDKAIGKIKNSKERQIVGGLVRTALETTPPSDVMLDKALRTARGVAALKLGLQTSLRNLTGANNILTRTDFESYLRGLAKTQTSEGKMWGHESGATAGPTLSTTEGVGGWSAKYYKGIAFSGSETKLRQHSANAGTFYIQKMARRYYNKLQTGRVDQWALRELKAIGIRPEEVIANKGLLTRDQMLRAGFKITMDTQHSYHPLDLPAAFTSTELGRALFMFKPYAAQQSRFLMKNTIDLLRRDSGGNRYAARGWRNIAILLTVYPASGEVINDIIALAKGEKRESTLVKRYLEDLVYAGGVGVLADLYGAIDFPSSAMGTAAGPLIGMPAEAIELGTRIAKNGMTDANARALIRRIPGIGPLLAPRLFPKDEDSGKETTGTRRPGSVPRKASQPRKAVPRKAAPRRTP